jgi:hypothetical protein
MLDGCCHGVTLFFDDVIRDGWELIDYIIFHPEPLISREKKMFKCVKTGFVIFVHHNCSLNCLHARQWACATP